MITYAVQVIHNQFISRFTDTERRLVLFSVRKAAEGGQNVKTNPESSQA